MTAGLLVLVFSVGQPAADSVREVTQLRSASPYNPIDQSPPGRATVVGDDPAVPGHPGPIGRYAPPCGQVYEPAFCMKNGVHGSPTGYEPRAGDLVFFVSDTWIWPVLYTFALTGEPYHVGIVVQMPDESFRLLEAGPPEMTQQVQLAPMPERLESYSGRVFIRRRSEPLAPEHSAALTDFACRQEGKRYALFRFLCQGTPFRSRGPIRTEYMGKCHCGTSSSYFCSELVTEALVACGQLDTETARPRATVMEDLFYDQSSNPYINKHLKLCPCWGPPQFWVRESCSHRGLCGCGK